MRWPDRSADQPADASAHRRGLRIWFAYAAGVAVLVGLMLALVANVEAGRVQQERAQWWRLHTLGVLSTAEQIDTAVNKVLRGERGYLLTLHPLSRATFERGLRDYRRAGARLRALIRDNPRQQQRVDALDRRTRLLFDVATRSVAQASVDRADAAPRPATGPERVIIDDVTAILDAIKAEEHALLRQREAMHAATTARTRQHASILAGLVGVLMLIACASVAVAYRSRATALAAARRAGDSERRYRLMADNSNDMVVRLGLDGIRLGVSPACRAILGYDVDELLGGTPVSVIHPDDRAAVVEVCRSLLTGADRPVATYRQQHRDGHYVWLEASYQLVRDTGGAPLEVVASVRDIGRRHVAEHEAAKAAARARESNRLFSMAASMANIGHWRVDLIRDEVVWSDEVYGIYGLGRDHTPTLENAIDPYHPDDRACVAELVERAITTGAPFEFVGRLAIAQGRHRTVTVKGQAERAPDDTVIGIFGVIRDISAQVASEEAIRASERQYRLLADHSTDVVLRTGTDGSVLYISPACIDMSGYAPEELVGQPASAFIHPDDQAIVHAAHVAIITGVRDTVTVEYRLRHKRTGWRWLESNMKAWRTANATECGVLSAIRDVENRKLLEVALRDARDRAEAAARAKAAFLANMSHEIRTPMNGVIGFTELVLASALMPEQRRQIELIADSGRSMMRLLNDILDLSKMQSGKMVLADEAVDLRHVMRRCVELMAPTAMAKNVRLSATFDARVPATIRGDALRLRQVLLNLIGNAAKFTQAGTITVATALEGDRLRIDVADTGIGIPVDRLSAIFEQFAQADGTVVRDYGGTGLGLSISADLVRMMGGTISVASVVGVGTTFSVTIPCVAAQGLPVVRAAAVGREAGAPLTRRPRVLIAEDHDINQALITAMAERAGLAAEIAADGVEAFAMVEDAARAGRPYALVLMDMQMPRMGGLEATRRLRAAGHDAERLPVVALTANAYAEDVAACLDAGMQAHLAKPLSMNDLADVLLRYVRDAGPTAAPPAMSPAVLAAYRRRKAQARVAIERLSANGHGDAAQVADAADVLHKLAGTAAIFGEAGLGDAARALETAIDASPAGDHADAVARLLLSLRAAA